MYDKITAWIDRAVIGEERFEALSWHANERGWFSLGSFNFKCLPNTIKCTGSVNKCHLGHNLKALTFVEVCEVIDDLCNWIQVDPSEIRVTTIEFGATFAINNPPSRYLELLGELSRTKRLPIAKGQTLQTIVYQTSYYKHIFYDKGEEAGIDENLLRFELRYYKNIHTQLLGKGGSIWLSTLRDADFYRKLQSIYIKTFTMIKKLGELNASTSTKVKGVKDAKDMLLAQLLESDPTIIGRFVEDLKRKRIYNDPKYYSRLKKELNDALKLYGGTTNENPDLIAELTHLVEQEIKRCSPLE